MSFSDTSEEAWTFPTAGWQRSPCERNTTSPKPYSIPPALVRSSRSGRPDPPLRRSLRKDDQLFQTKVLGPHLLGIPAYQRGFPGSSPTSKPSKPDSDRYEQLGGPADEASHLLVQHGDRRYGRPGSYHRHGHRCRRPKSRASIKYQALLLGQVRDGIVGADSDTRIESLLERSTSTFMVSPRRKRSARPPGAPEARVLSASRRS